MNLIINFTEKRGEVELELQEGKELIDALDFSFHANLDDLLITSVQKMRYIGNTSAVSFLYGQIKQK